MIKHVGILFLFALAACAPSEENEKPLPEVTEIALPSVGDAEGECTMDLADALWIDQAMANWTFARENILDVPELKDVEAVFFSKECVLTNKTIMTSGDKTPWKISAHGGTVKLPDGDEMPPVVTSFSFGMEQGGYFAMSTPSVWREGGVKSNMGLETLMYAVMLHEGSHVLQFSTFGDTISHLSEIHNLPEDFNDDSVQDLFEQDEEYAAAIAAETAKFIEAAQAPSLGESRALAQEGLDMITDRRENRLSGEFAKYREIDDVWLTLEGSGQWVGYAWLVHPEGGGIDPQTAIDEWGLRGRFWTQSEGFAVALALDRLTSAWKTPAFKDGSQMISQMMAEALAEN